MLQSIELVGCQGHRKEPPFSLGGSRCFVPGRFWLAPGTLPPKAIKKHSRGTCTNKRKNLRQGKDACKGTREKKKRGRKGFGYNELRRGYFEKSEGASGTQKRRSIGVFYGGRGPRGNSGLIPLAQRLKPSNLKRARGIIAGEERERERKFSGPENFCENLAPMNHMGKGHIVTGAK